MKDYPKKISIEDLCIKVSSGGTPSRKIPEYWDGGTIPWVKTGELKDAKIFDAEEKITEAGLESSSAKKFPINTILMAMYGDGKTITSLGILKEELATNQACCAMIADPNKCDYRFLYYSLMHNRKRLLGLVVAGAQRNLSIGIIKRFEVDYFPLETQKAIANILSSYDDLIENNKRRITLLEDSVQQLYKEWFVRFRFPGHEHVKIIDGVPDGWNKVQVGDLLTLQRGFDLPVKVRKNGAIPIYASTGINGYHNEHKVEGPGIVTGRSGSLGSVMFVIGNFWPLNTALWVKEFKQVTPHYALFFLRELQLENYNGGAAVPTLNRNDVHRIETFAPPVTLLEVFSSIAAPSFEQIDKLFKQNKKLIHARDLLLPKLMSGELSV